MVRNGKFLLNGNLAHACHPDQLGKVIQDSHGSFRAMLTGASQDPMIFK